jgi:hypothetical protein
MQKAVETILHLCMIWEEKAWTGDGGRWPEDRPQKTDYRKPSTDNSKPTTDYVYYKEGNS